ncbi:cobalamin-5'-phosphate synthase [Marinobacterium halophilum]|uniref:Adenosylcobinamide-GDP ribazoletransferase n=1 Tax=Marinobacterium halophilum TaxID=267374 RepID=A0A2P8ERT8_9GAMM|nr:adenosylcobinamide-GDP ribazoletransferase [Marinobacterium halophilum]PSL12201.1 cobalamin-5'-phosphate synthase [Marinobacterium halophilum]
MQAHWQAFLCALQFLTLIPVRLAGMPDQATQARAFLYYPLVGLLLGGLLLGLVWLTQGLPVAVQATLVLVLWCGVTGGLHLDGLADSADGWMGGLGDRERTLRIMKDPHLGGTGALVLMLQLLLKWSLLQALLAESMWLPILLAPLVGRSAVQFLLLGTPYARPGGIAQGLQQLSRLPILVCGVMLAVLLLWLHPLVPVMVMVTFWGLRLLMQRRLQGYTGDTAGAVIELQESVVLITALVVL